MDWLRFEIRTLQYSWNATWNFCARTQIWLGIAIAGITPLALSGFIHWSPWIKRKAEGVVVVEEWIVALAGFAVVSTIVLLAGIVNLVLAPSRMERQKNEAWNKKIAEINRVKDEVYLRVESLESQRDDLLQQLKAKRHKQNVLDELAELLNQTHNIINRKINNESELTVLESEVNDWHNNTYKLLESEFSQAMALAFRNADGPTAIKWNNAFNDNHNKTISKMRGLRSFLNEFIQDQQSEIGV